MKDAGSDHRSERHSLSVVKGAGANREKLGFRLRAPNLMQKLIGGFNPQSDKIHILFHLLDLSIVSAIRRTGHFVESADIVQDIAPGGQPALCPSIMLSNLFEEPRVANRS